MIEKIMIEGLKGLDGIYDLAPLTAIVAPNGSGKTAILDAVQLVTTGAHPSFGKTGKAIMQMAPGTSMSIEATLKDGRALSRQFTMGKGGRVSCKADLPHDWPTTGLAMAFSPAEFLALNERGRVDYILANVPEGTIPESSKIRDLIDRRCAGPDRITPEDVEAFDRPLADVLADAKATCLDARRSTKQDLKRYVETVRGLEDGLRDAEAPDRVEQERVEELRAHWQEAQREWTRISERHREAKRRLERFQALPKATWSEEDDEHLKALEAEFLALEMAARRTGDIQERLSAIMRGSPEPEEVEEAEAICENYVRPEPGEREDLREKHRGLSEALVVARSKVEHLEQAISQHEADTRELLEHDACPTCGAAGAAFRAPLSEAREAVRVGMISELQGRKDHLASIQDDLRSCNEEIKLLEARELIERDAEATMAIEALRKEQAEAKAGTTTGKLESLRAEVSELRQRRADARAIATIGDIPTPEAVAELADKEADCRAVTEARAAEVRAIVAAHSAWLQHGGAMRQLEAAKEGAGQAEKRLQEIVDLIDTIEGAAGEMAQAIASPLRVGLRQFTEGVLPGEVHVRTDLTIAYQDERGTRPFEALSGGERAIVAFGLSAFLATLTPLRLACFDEASVLDADWRPAFLDRIAERVADGTLAQAIATDHNASGFAKANWTTLDLR